jgi:hypothetical protein
MFSHLPWQRREDAGHPPQGNRRSLQNWCYCCMQQSHRIFCVWQSQHCSSGHCLSTRNIFDHFIFLGLAVHLIGKDLIYSLDIQVIICSHGSRDCDSCGRICLACQEEEGRLLGTVINLILFSFWRHVEVLASERENMSCTNNAPQGMGSNHNKATLYALHLKTMENRLPLV